MGGGAGKRLSRYSFIQQNIDPKFTNQVPNFGKILLLGSSTPKHHPLGKFNTGMHPDQLKQQEYAVEVGEEILWINWLKIRIVGSKT